MLAADREAGPAQWRGGSYSTNISRTLRTSAFLPGVMARDIVQVTHEILARLRGGVQEIALSGAHHLDHSREILFEQVVGGRDPFVLGERPVLQVGHIARDPGAGVHEQADQQTYSDDEAREEQPERMRRNATYLASGPWSRAGP